MKKTKLRKKQKLTKKEKIFLWTGAGIVLFVLVAVVMFVVVPQIVEAKYGCVPYFTTVPPRNFCDHAGFFFFGILALGVFGAPIAAIGLAMIVYAILSFKKVKKSEPSTIACWVFFIVTFGYYWWMTHMV